MSEAQLDELEPLLRPEDIEATSVYPIIHMIRADMMRNGNGSIVFCFLLNRVYFLRDDNVLTTTISYSRAALCELLAIRTFRDYGNSMLQLTLALTTSWPVYNGADPHIIQQAREERDDDLEDRVGNAIEMAILGKSKRFIKSSACQRVINAIWTGKCVYQAESSHSILSDTYKRTPIHFYDPHKAPLLDHYRLKVPAIRSVLEYFNFVILFILFVVAIEVSQRDKLDAPEIIFIVYSLGFSLEKIAAMQEHGIRGAVLSLQQMFEILQIDHFPVYFTGTWNGFDLAFITIYALYATLRLYGFYHNVLWARELGVDCLAIIACLLFPRLAFVTLKDNLMVLSLRAMISQFVAMMLIAAFCFCGFLYALWTLSQSQSAGYSIGTIAWWMLDIWFGLDASGFHQSADFHPVFGPILIVTYACLSNTLLLTVLVSILTNTFATINEDAAAEAMFRKAVSTIEGVKADSLFSYQPPINLFALGIMLPARYLLSPRWFHKINVFMIRITSFPILLAISIYERQSKKTGATNFYETITAVAERVFDTLPRSLKRLTFFEGLVGSDADISAIFEIAEEYESALDLNDSASFQYNADQRARRRSSGHMQHGQTTGNGGPAAPTPRTRLNSVMHRGTEVTQSFVSPLAQVFQPLMVDDTIREESPDKDSDEPSSAAPSSQPTSPAVSYGPALSQAPVSQSPDPMLETVPTAPASPERVTEELAEESKGDPAGELAFERRLNDIEKRQERIEELLLQIARDVKR
ncbi:hypothetical protein H0H92_006293 [Tricholoma furcatifolium]|nr:hypothetical protein H0H92_006293 [Tricholoma furcatifolium]